MVSEEKPEMHPILRMVVGEMLPSSGASLIASEIETDDIRRFVVVISSTRATESGLVTFSHPITCSS
jgi:hypothetical protein